MSSLTFDSLLLFIRNIIKNEPSVTLFEISTEPFPLEGCNPEQSKTIIFLLADKFTSIVSLPHISLAP